jgi:hypothetical protein
MMSTTRWGRHAAVEVVASGNRSDIRAVSERPASRKRLSGSSARCLGGRPAVSWSVGGSGGLRRPVVESRPAVPGIRPAASRRRSPEMLAPPGVLIGALAATSDRYWGPRTPHRLSAQPVRGTQLVSQAPGIATGPTAATTNPSSHRTCPRVRAGRVRMVAHGVRTWLRVCQLDRRWPRPGAAGARRECLARAEPQDRHLLSSWHAQPTSLASPTHPAEAPTIHSAGCCG